jgi:hypothetical protein
LEQTSVVPHCECELHAQSAAQVAWVSLGAEQIPSPQTGPLDVEQSLGQLSALSPESQAPFPQNAETEQSAGQLAVVSPCSQVAFPQTHPSPPVPESQAVGIARRTTVTM